MELNKKIFMKLEPDWIVGFTDAEGHFSVTTNRNTIRSRFIITQDIRSIHVLHAIQAFFGVGCVRPSKGASSYDYTVTKLNDLNSTILPFFERTRRLQSQKYYDWLKFRHALQQKSSVPNVDICDIRSFAIECKKEKKPNRQISADWFIGFTDGDGCFAVSLNRKHNLVTHQFIIGAHGRDAKRLMERIQDFIGCGTVYMRKSGIVIFQVSGRKDLLVNLFPLFYTSNNCHTLRTHKRRRASLFWRIVQYMQDFERRDEKVLRIIGQWKDKMRFPKKEEEKVRPLARAGA